MVTLPTYNKVEISNIFNRRESVGLVVLIIIKKNCSEATFLCNNNWCKDPVDAGFISNSCLLLTVRYFRVDLVLSL